MKPALLRRATALRTKNRFKSKDARSGERMFGYE